MPAIVKIEKLHEEIRLCRKCESDGFPITPPPLVSGHAPAPFMVIGQAPGISCLRGREMYLGPAGRKLREWLRQAGFQDTDIGTVVYMTALTKCYPGRVTGNSKDRAPSGRERTNCRHWLDAEIALVQPSVVILFGKMAIDAYLPRMPLEEAVGKAFERDGVTYVPLPHSSGASTWLNDAGHQALLSAAIGTIREQRRLYFSL